MEMFVIKVSSGNQETTDTRSYTFVILESDPAESLKRKRRSRKIDEKSLGYSHLTGTGVLEFSEGIIPLNTLQKTQEIIRKTGDDPARIKDMVLWTMSRAF